jgi:hypothetical protein
MNKYKYGIPPAHSGETRAENSFCGEVSSPRKARSQIPRISRRLNNHIHYSPLRPHVLAHQRLLSWSPPPTFTPSYQSLAQFLPGESITILKTVILQSIDEATRANYGAGLLRFHQFCDIHNIPESLRFPASEPLISLFIANAGAGKVHISLLPVYIKI